MKVTDLTRMCIEARRWWREFTKPIRKGKALWAYLTFKPTRKALDTRKGLSDGVIKNLFSVLRFTNLAVSAVSLGLLSNVVISCSDITTKAHEQLHELQRIIHGAGDITASELIAKAAQAQDKSLGEYWEYNIQLPAKEFELPKPAELTIVTPGVVHRVPSANKGGGQIGSSEISLLPIQGYYLGIYMSDLAHCHEILDPIIKNRRSLFVSGPPSQLFLRKQISTKGNLWTRTPGEFFDLPLQATKTLALAPESSLFPEVIDIVETTDQGVLLRLGYFLPPLERSSFRNATLWDIANLRNYDYLVAEFPLTPITSDPWAYLLTTAGHPDARLISASSFEDAFPSLAKWGEHYGALSFYELETVLKEQSRESKGELEAFGAKIPNELIALIGIPSLIMLLLQFISAMTYLLRDATLDIEQASRWSLMLRGTGFSAFGFSTMLVLPTVASIATLVFATQETWYRIPLWFTATVLVVILSLIAITMLNTLRGRVINNQSRIRSDLSEDEDRESSIYP